MGTQHCVPWAGALAEGTSGGPLLLPGTPAQMAAQARHWYRQRWRMVRVEDEGRIVTEVKRDDDGKRISYAEAG